MNIPRAFPKGLGDTGGQRVCQAQSPRRYSIREPVGWYWAPGVDAPVCGPQDGIPDCRSVRVILLAIDVPRYA